MAQRFLLAASFSAFTLWLGFWACRADFWPLIAAYAALFGLYLYIIWCKTWRDTDLRWLIGLGLGLRAALVFSQPNLSDDFYRFFWDGTLVLNGIHPFAHLPVYFSENGIWPPGLSPELFAQLNSPRYFSVYPPVCQAVFAAGAWLFPGNVTGGVALMKLFLLACEAGTIFILTKHKPKGTLAPAPLLYALNPLAILEICGNCHFEGAMLFFLLAGLHVLWRGKVAWAAVFWALSVATKLLPLLFFPLIFRHLWKNPRFRDLKKIGPLPQAPVLFLGVFGAVSLLLFWPMFDLAMFTNMSQSLDFYFQKFEFNASLYYVLREIGFWAKGYNIGHWLGPRLGLLTFAGVIWLTFGKMQTAGKPMSEDKRLVLSMFWAICLYFLCAPIVHPWYALVPLALCVFTDWRFPVIWSGTVILSYSHYIGGGLQERFWLIALEYAAVLAFFFFEKKRATINNESKH